MKKDTKKHPQQEPSRLVLKKETLRKLRPAELETAMGGGDQEIGTGIKNRD